MNGRRVGVLSQRELRPEVARCTGYEFEDVLGSVEQVDLLCPVPHRGTRLLERNASRALAIARHLPRSRRLYRPLEWDAQTYDLVVAVFEFPQDVMSLGALPRLKSIAGKSVCILEEVWTAEVKGRLGPHVDRIAETFDVLYTTAYNSIPALEARTGRTWRFLPFAVDMTCFGPVAVEKSRPIDVINLGRRSEITHRALVDWSVARGAFYYFDSFRVGPVKRCSDHRLLLADLMRSSTIAITNRGVGADPAATGYEESLAFRFFESAAAGAVMVGDRPDVGVFDDLFDWPDALFDAPFDEPDIGDLIDDLLAQPDRLRRSSLRGIAASLRRHDHGHRWATILADLGLDPTPALSDRLAELAQRAARLPCPEGDNVEPAPSLTER